MKKINAYRITLVMLFHTPFAFADSTTTVDKVLQSFLSYITSTPAQILAVLAIAAVGYNTLHTGKIPKHVGVSVIIGIAILFSAPSIFTMLTGFSV